MAPCAVLQVEADYSFYERIRVMLEDNSANIEDCIFSDNVKIIFSIRDTRVDDISQKLNELSNGKYSFVKIGEKYAKV